MAWTTVKLAERVFKVEYKFDITHSGNSGNYDEPSEAAEYTIDVLSLREARQELELPTWLKKLLEQHLSEDREDINEIIQEADMDRDYYEET